METAIKEVPTETEETAVTGEVPDDTPEMAETVPKKLGGKKEKGLPPAKTMEPIELSEGKDQRFKTLSSILVGVVDLERRAGEAIFEIVTCLRSRLSTDAKNEDIKKQKQPIAEEIGLTKYSQRVRQDEHSAWNKFNVYFAQARYVFTRLAPSEWESIRIQSAPELKTRMDNIIGKTRDKSDETLTAKEKLSAAQNNVMVIQGQIMDMVEESQSFRKEADDLAEKDQSDESDDLIAGMRADADELDEKIQAARSEEMRILQVQIPKFQKESADSAKSAGPAEISDSYWQLLSGTDTTVNTVGDIVIPGVSVARTLSICQRCVNLMAQRQKMLDSLKGENKETEIKGPQAAEVKDALGLTDAKKEASDE